MTATLATLTDGHAITGTDGDTMVTGLTADSRQVRPGYVFAALPGSNTDGSRFIADALNAGASAIVVPHGLKMPEPGRVPVVEACNPRALFARMVARFYRRQPDIVAAVTGTNGKTSVTSFVRQIWQRMGISAASVGTTGVTGPNGTRPLMHTTPDPVTLHNELSLLAEEGVSHLALEASSHGLDQHRLDGVRLTCAAFTNISRDHLDYHPTFESYFEAKMRLFDDLLQPATAAVINADTVEAEEIAHRCAQHDVTVISVGTAGEGLTLAARERHGFGQRLTITGAFARHSVYLPLVGEFQASNAMIAAGLVIAAGGPADIAILALEGLKGASGRLELVTRTRSGAPVFVDYAHTPDALVTALGALRHCVDDKLRVVFGCGGDRDPGKRALMGAAAATHADVTYITDDNPRSEQPGRIRRQALEGCPDGIEVPDRRAAIYRAIEEAGRGDVVLIAGKGHETGQTVGDHVIPFSDQQVAREATGARDHD